MITASVCIQQARFVITVLVHSWGEGSQREWRRRSTQRRLSAATPRSRATSALVRYVACCSHRGTEAEVNAAQTCQRWSWTGPGTVVHPKAVVRALGGPIVLGVNNLVEENAELVNRSVPVAGRDDCGRLRSLTAIHDQHFRFSTGRSTEPMVIGDGNRFGTGCGMLDDHWAGVAAHKAVC